MKFKVTMKDPDVLSDAIEEAVEADLIANDSLTADDREALFDSRRTAAANVAGKWFRWGEYLEIEIDTVAGTATVCPVQ